MRPVFYDYTSSGCDSPMSFTLGRDVMIAASPKPESPQAYDVCLPKGGWYDYWTGRSVVAVAGKTADSVTETPRIDRLPVFVRAGAIIPRQPLVQSLSETPTGALELLVYPGDDCHGTIYFDDGKADAIARGAYLRQSFRCSTTPKGLRIDLDPRSGKLKPWWREIAMTVHAVSDLGAVRVGRRKIAAEMDESADRIRFTLPDSAKAATITVVGP